MAAFRPRVVGAIVRKDFISLWPLVIGAGLVPLCMVADLLIKVDNSLKVLLVGIGVLATAALVLTAFHQDAVASVRHDALTRPIGRVTLVFSKLVFLFLTLAVPICAAQFAREVIKDHTLAEAALSTIALLSFGGLAAIPIVILALVTASMVEAFVMVFTLVIISVGSSIVLPSASGDGGVAQWTTDALSSVAGALFAIGVLLLLFWRKSPGLARVAYVAALICIIAFNYVPGDAAVAMQSRLLDPEPAASTLKTTMRAVCTKDRGQKSAAMVAELTASGAPAGSRIAVDQIRMAAVGGDGRMIKTKFALDSAPEVTDKGVDRWSVVSPIMGVAPNATLQWSYKLTLLEATAAQTLPADGKRRYLPGFGYCQTRTAGGRTRIDCFKPFSQPAVISAEIVGRPDTLCMGCTKTSYRPAVLEGFGASRGISTRGVAGPSQVVRLIAYEPRWQSARKSTTPATAAICAREKS